MELGMNILSLFDGMSGCQLSLERAKIKVDNYYASEVDKYAIQVTQANYPNTIQLGSVVDLTDEQLKELKIDLLVGGSPCQGFSIAGKMKGMSTKEGVEITTLAQYLKLKSENFEFDGQSYLFWEFMRVKSIINPKYFLLENVRIQKKWKEVFDEVVGVEPIMINSSLVSAQNRVRYYWTNIPNVVQPIDRGILLKDIVLTNEIDEKFYLSEKAEAYTKRERNGKPRLEYHKNPLDGKATCIVAVQYKGVPYGVLKEERPCTLRDTTDNKSECNHVADADDINGHDSIKRVYSEEGKSPTINTCTGGNREVKVLCGASRGRYLIDNVRQDAKDATAGKTKQYLEVRGDEKTNCLTTVQKDNCITDKQEPGRYELTESVYRRLTPLECERLQTVPDNYTESVSNSQRYKMLGNGFTIEVVAHILKNIPQNRE